MSAMPPEEAADQWFEANPPPPLTDQQVTALRALLGIETGVTTPPGDPA